MAANRLRSWAFATLAGVALWSCGDEGPDEQPGIPNPASVYCEEQGGTLQIETDDDGGQIGICVLPTGERIEEWEFYRANSVP